ncbi:hypothetical protein DITRI_Ditri02bG0153800 [Diplodiscus trichospermus]
MDNATTNHETAIQNNSSSEENLFNDLAIQIQSQFDALKCYSQRPLIQDHIIYCVDPLLREVNKAAYKPNFVIIGPLCCYPTVLEHIEMQKRMYLASFLHRDKKNKASLSHFFKLIKESADRFHAHYDETYYRSWDFRLHKIQQIIQVNDGRYGLFIKMVLVDVGLIIKLFLRAYNKELDKGKTDFILETQWKLHDIRCVKFKVSTSRCLLDIEFIIKNEKLKIPALKVDESTESFFRNLMAWEQCYYSYDTYICNYIFLMEYLIKSTKDVDLLIRRRIIINQLGSNTVVVTLFSDFCKYITLAEKNRYFNIFRELNAYNAIRHHSWIAVFKLQYFSTLWRGDATIVAVVLLVLTLIQTICALISL